MQGIACIVLCYQRPPPGDLLDALRHVAPALTIYVVSVGTAKPTSAPPDSHVRQLLENRGYAASMNLGLADVLSAGASWVLLLTHDVHTKAVDVEALVDVASTHPEFGIIGPRVAWRGESAAFSLGGVHDERGLPTHRRTESGEAGAIVECDWIDGCAMLIRREVFEQIGFFDERFFLYFEETDFCLRARRAGWKIGVVTAAEVEQEPGLSRRPEAYTYLLTRNGLEYSRRRAGTRGVVSALRRELLDSVGAARVIASPRTERGVRLDYARLLHARWRGVFDFGRRRWGRPPKSITKRSDIV